ncbi:hypothetical protein PMAYCL1PPCAC_00678, partial [Pristionchus mayeri]
VKERRHQLRELAQIGTGRPRTAIITARTGLSASELKALGTDDTLRSVYRRGKRNDLDETAANTAPFVYQGSMSETEGKLRYLFHDSGATDPKRIVIYASDTQLEMLSKSTRISYDGTFASAPDPYGSVFSIHCEVLSRRSIPSGSRCLHDGWLRKQQEYRRILDLILQSPILATWAPIEAHCDFEQASRLAFRYYFPRIAIRICLF